MLKSKDMVCCLQVVIKHRKKLILLYLGLPRHSSEIVLYSLGYYKLTILIELSEEFARTCGLFFKIRHFLPTDVLIALYNSMFSFFFIMVLQNGNLNISHLQSQFSYCKRK